MGAVQKEEIAACWTDLNWCHRATHFSPSSQQGMEILSREFYENKSPSNFPLHINYSFFESPGHNLVGISFYAYIHHDGRASSAKKSYLSVIPIIVE